MIDVLTPCAQLLVTHKVGSSGKYAAPCFEFYGGGENRDQLFEKLDDLGKGLEGELLKTKEKAQEDGDSVAEEAIGEILKRVEDLSNIE